jgi:hypothetical protein
MWFMAPLAHTGALRLGMSTGLFDNMIGDQPEQQANEPGRHTSVPEATHLSLLTDREHSRATVDAVRGTLTAAETAATRPR